MVLLFRHNLWTRNGSLQMKAHFFQILLRWKWKWKRSDVFNFPDSEEKNGIPSVILLNCEQCEPIIEPKHIHKCTMHRVLSDNEKQEKEEKNINEKMTENDIKSIAVLRTLKWTSNMKCYDAEEDPFLFDIYKMHEHNRIENRCGCSKSNRKKMNWKPTHLVKVLQFFAVTRTSRHCCRYSSINRNINVMKQQKI